MGIKCTLSKSIGYVHHGESFLGNDSEYLTKKQDGRHGRFCVGLLQNTPVKHKTTYISLTVRDRAISAKFLTLRVTVLSTRPNF